MSDVDVRSVEQGLDAWRRGDLSVIERMLEPDATWRASEPGEWDCENRDDIVRTLRERYEQGFGRGRIEVVAGGPEKVIAVAWPREIGGDEWPEETATVISFRDGKVVSMQDYATRDEALRATGEADA